jgi:surface antigen
MTIKSSLAALTAVFSVVFFLAPAAHAEQPKTDTKTKNTPVIVTVQPGDTLTSIADAHNTTYVRIFDANANIADPNLINPDDQVRIPTADEQLPDRMADLTTVQPSAYQATSYAKPTAPRQNVAKPTYVSSAGNTYYYGYCTWYVKNRRPDLPNMLGNGGQWVANAAARGYATGTTPQAGAVAEIPGHVAYVESVNGDGTIVISEMNGPAGWGVVDTRTVPASQYRYIY